MKNKDREKKAENLIKYQDTIPVRHQTEILVAGGGAAGIAAALAARRQGRQVRLIEAHSCLGGMSTAGLVPAFCQFTDGVNFLADGIGRQILESLQENGAAFPGNGTCIRVEPALPNWRRHSGTVFSR